MNDELLDQWESVKLCKILQESKIESSKPSVDRRIRVLLNAKGVIKRPTKKETKGATKYFIRKKGQFIYGKQNIHKGAFGIVPDDLHGFESTSDLPAFDVDERCLPVWIDYYFKQGSFYLDLVNIARGAATKRVQPKELLELEIPLPPLKEQRKIVAHFKSVETEDTELRAELTHQQSLLKKLRQQILQEAIEGKLTADWRKQNPEVESADELLKRIQAEKEQLIKDKKIKKQKPLPPISEDEKPFDLPVGWKYARPEELVINEPYTLGIGPFGSDLLASDYRTSGIPLIFVKNITNNNFDFNLRFVSAEKGEQLKAHKVKPGYIVITKMGDPPGTATIYQNKKNNIGILTADCIKFGINDMIISKYVLLAIMSNVTQLQLGILSKGMGRKKLSLKRFKTVLIPLPPLAEQKAIVTKVEKLLSLCDQLEAQVTDNQTHAEQLMQAVLKEAFSQGEVQTEQVAVNA